MWRWPHESVYKYSPHGRCKAWEGIIAALSKLSCRFRGTDPAFRLRPRQAVQMRGMKFFGSALLQQGPFSVRHVASSSKWTLMRGGVGSIAVMSL